MTWTKLAQHMVQYFFLIWRHKTIIYLVSYIVV
jgi:hypothetical protein